MGNLTFSLSVALLGMMVVFVGLVLLIGAIRGVSALINKTEKKPAQPSVKPEAQVQSQPVLTPAVVEENIDVAVDDTQLIAVIAAALMAYQGTGKQLVVRSVRRVGTRSAWAEAGRRERLG